MTTLAQIIAVGKGVQSKAESALTKAYHTLQRGEEFNGFTKTYRPKDEEGAPLPSEAKKVRAQADQIIEQTSKDLVRLFDVTLTKESANTLAKADIVIDGNVLVQDVPVTYLLFLDKQLVNLRTFVSKIPTLDPAEDWHYDNTTGLQASTPRETTRGKKVKRTLTLFAGNDKHPPQVQPYDEEELEGYWSTVKYSGAYPVDMVNDMLDRVDKIRDAVRQAREAANTLEIQDRVVGNSILTYVFG